MDWGYWRSVLLITLSVLVVMLLYRKLLRWIGGNTGFDNKFAFLFPLERKDTTLTISFDLPEGGLVSLLILNELNAPIAQVLDQEKLAGGKHEYTIDATQLDGKKLTCLLSTGNQKLERYFNL